MDCFGGTPNGDLGALLNGDACLVPFDVPNGDLGDCVVDDGKEGLVDLGESSNGLLSGWIDLDAGDGDFGAPNGELD